MDNYLLSRGIVASSMETIGRGFENPVASNETEEGGSINRRIGIRIH